jgi:hypothetical protein
MTTRFGTPKPIRKIEEVVPLYGLNEFESATRSTVPMLDLLIHSCEEFNTIIGKIGFPKRYHRHLEYTVGPFDGRGKASHTDVMLTYGDNSLAIEAKWTEPMYETVEDWLEKGTTKTNNKKAVLNGWLEKLTERLGPSYSAPDFDCTIYQMLHRAASAAVAGKRPRLAYFIFKPSPTGGAASANDIFTQLSSLWKLLGSPDAFPFYAVEIKLKELATFTVLPKTKDEATDEAVRAALQDGKKLFDFSLETIQPVG